VGLLAVLRSPRYPELRSEGSKRESYAATLTPWKKPNKHVPISTLIVAHALLGESLQNGPIGVNGVCVPGLDIPGKSLGKLQLPIPPERLIVP